MNSSQLERWLRRRGCAFETKRGTGHKIVRRGGRKSELPIHGGARQLGRGLISKILKDLGIDEPIPN